MQMLNEHGEQFSGQGTGSGNNVRKYDLKATIMNFRLADYLHRQQYLDILLLGLWCHWSDSIQESTLWFPVQKGGGPKSYQAMLDKTAEAEHIGCCFSFRV